MTEKPTYEELERRVQELECLMKKNVTDDLYSKEGLPDLADIVDIPTIQSLMDYFFSLTNIGVAIIDLKGTILVATGWQDICTRFHRVHPETCKNCLESDLILSNGVKPGTFKLYQCKNQMWDMATPIMAGDRKVGNLFLGQFLFQDESPDINAFKNQARQYGFDENQYLKALEKVPRWTRKIVNEVMGLYTTLANLISDLGYRNLLLNKSEERFRTIFESATDYIFLKDSELCYSMVNPAMATLFDKPREELIGQTDWEIFGGKVTEHIHQIDTRVLDGEIIEEEITKPVKGIPVTFHVKKIPFRGPDGNIAGLCGMARDITRQKKAENNLRANRENLESIIEHLPVGIGIHDTQGNILSLNQQFRKMFGYTKNDIPTIEDWAIKAYPDKGYRERTFAVWDQYLKKSLETGLKTPPMDVEITCKDKTTRNVIISLQPADNQHLTTFVDITERKYAEAEAARLMSAVEQAAEIFVITNPDGIIQYVNPAFERITGYTQKEVLGSNPRILKSGKQDNAFYQHLWQTILSGKPWHGRIVNKKKDRSFYTEETIISPVLDTSGEIVNFVAVKRDLTHAIKMEEKLHQAQKMESIGSLAGGIAHDFNNILFPIIGYSQLIIDDFDPGSPEYESLKAIMDAGERGRNLVRQILAIGRQSEQQPIPVQIQTVLKEVLKLVRSTIPTNIHITKDIQKDCGALQADPTQLHQIAMNLITNASHALEDDVGEIAVELKEVELEAGDFISENMEPGRYAVLTVSDTGSGISPDIMEKLFDPYFTTKEQGKGTGLGLSVVHGIVKGYGGDIKVYSELGKGTSFHVYLPVINQTGEIAETENNRPLPTGNERILVVDDEAPIIRLEEALLKKLGYKVSSRTGSIDALEKFKQNPYAFDLVLTDMSMPNMTGEKLAREMIAIRPDIPVILCTGFSERLDEKKTETAGVKAFLMKPIVNRDIAETVRKVLDEAKI